MGLFLILVTIVLLLLFSWDTRCVFYLCLFPLARLDGFLASSAGALERANQLISERCGV